MAHGLHLKILSHGRVAWNEWKAKKRHGTINLGNANLTGKNLSQYDLSGVNFANANLTKANLSEADLSGANLQKANLTEAQAKGANLTWANLSEATLKYTDLSGANLTHTDLTGTRFNTSFMRGINLSEAVLTNRDFRGVDFSNANLHGSHLRKALLSKVDFSNTDLSEADLTEADLSYATFSKANLHDAILRSADLNRASLSRTNLTGADLLGANLAGSTLIRTNLEGADLTGCLVYGISVWDVGLEGAIQFNLVITPNDEPAITVDNLEVAQFVYLLLNNAKIRYVIETITTKVVLILGRFTPERKAVLDEIRSELRRRNYIPILFDFEKPASRDLTETITTLARLARFIIADITDPRSIPQELEAIVPHMPSVAVQPLILSSQSEYGMFEHFTRFQWVLPIYHYADQENLLRSLKEKVIEPAEQKAKELEKQ